jgi:hypothetical protein
VITNDQAGRSDGAGPRCGHTTVLRYGPPCGGSNMPARTRRKQPSRPVDNCLRAARPAVSVAAPDLPTASASTHGGRLRPSPPFPGRDGSFRPPAPLRHSEDRRLHRLWTTVWTCLRVTCRIPRISTRTAAPCPPASSRQGSTRRD